MIASTTIITPRESSRSIRKRLTVTNSAATTITIALHGSEKTMSETTLLDRKTHSHGPIHILTTSLFKKRSVFYQHYCTGAKVNVA